MLVRSLLGSLAAVGLGTGVLPASQERILTIPVVGPAASARCEYFADLVGVPPGPGAIDWGRVAKQAGAVVIDTAPVGTPTIRLRKAFVYCPGFDLTVLSDEPIRSASDRRPPINPAALPMVRLIGRVPVPTDNTAGSTVEILHYAYWIVESYGTWDGAVPQFRIASVPLDPNGTFSVELPDLAKDPWVSKFRDMGWFEFTTVIGGTARRLRPPAELAADFQTFGLVVPRGVSGLDVTFALERRR